MACPFRLLPHLAEDSTISVVVLVGQIWASFIFLEWLEKQPGMVKFANLPNLSNGLNEKQHLHPWTFLWREYAWIRMASTWHVPWSFCYTCLRKQSLPPYYLVHEQQFQEKHWRTSWPLSLLKGSFYFTSVVNRSGSNNDNNKSTTRTRTKIAN